MMKATNDSSVIAISVSMRGSRLKMVAVDGRCIASLTSASGPSNIQNVTKMPTARNATSFTIDSAATASIRPS